MGKTKQVFLAGDGQQFASEAAADRHNELTDAVKEFHDAGDKVRQCMLKTAITADGQPFDTRRTEYYWIHGAWSTSPTAQRLYIWPWQMSVDVEYGTGRIAMREWRTGDRGGGEYHTFHVDELYMTEVAANGAIAKLLLERISEIKDHITRLQRGG